MATNLAILELSGSTSEQHPDHLVARSTHNPGFHWGNCVVVTDPDAANTTLTGSRSSRSVAPGPGEPWQ